MCAWSFVLVAFGALCSLQLCNDRSEQIVRIDRITSERLESRKISARLKMRMMNWNVDNEVTATKTHYGMLT